MKDIAFGIGLVAIAVVSYYWIQIRVYNVPPQIARQKAAEWAFEIWLNGHFELPKRLLKHGLSADELIEIGHVLKSELVGRSTVRDISPVVSSPHPELANIDSAELAKDVHLLVLEDAVKTRA